MVHQNNSKNQNDIRTKLVIDIIPTFAIRKMMDEVGWGGFMSAVAWLGSGDSAAERSQSLVLQAYGSLLHWLEGGRSVVVLRGLSGLAVWLGLILANLLTYLVVL